MRVCICCARIIYMSQAVSRVLRVCSQQGHEAGRLSAPAQFWVGQGQLLGRPVSEPKLRAPNLLPA